MKGKTIDGRQQTTDNGRRMTDDGRRMTDEGGWTTDHGQWTTDNGRPTTNDQQPTANDQRTMANLQPSTFNFLLCAFCILLLASCNSTYTSKKKGYFRTDFPVHKYMNFERPGFPFSFEYPVYANIIRDSTYFDSDPENPYWINVDFPGFRGRIFLSYKIIGGKSTFKVKGANGQYKDSSAINRFDNLVTDAYNLTNKNQAVTNSIHDSIMHTTNGLTGIFFSVGGNAATAKQFFLSDTTKNFIRGALYFDATPNADSLRPVQDFLQKDIEHMINTFKWTK